LTEENDKRRDGSTSKGKAGGNSCYRKRKYDDDQKAVFPSREGRNVFAARDEEEGR